MTNGKNFENEKENFRAMCLEVIPLAEKFREIASKYGVQKTARLSVCKDGYMNFEVCDNDWEMVRIASGDQIRIRFSYSEEIRVERSGKDD